MVAAGAVKDDVSRRQEPGIGATDELAVLARLDIEHGNVCIDQPGTGVPDREQRVPSVRQELRPPMTLHESQYQVPVYSEWWDYDSPKKL